LLKTFLELSIYYKWKWARDRVGGWWGCLL
jgi:hypothetical protein